MAISITTAQQKAVSELYVAFFNRAADSEGLGFWAGALASGKSIASVAQDMYLTAPARAYYSTALTNEQFIKAFYTTVLNRATPDAEGVAFWTAALNQPSATQGSVAVQIMKAVRDYVDTPASPTNAAALTAKTLFAAKVDVSTAYALQGGTAAGASSVLVGVVDAATAATAIANLGSGTIGSTFTLTTGVDNIVGTAGNDTVLGAVSFTDSLTPATSGTYSAADQISGGTGTDKLSITVDGGGATYTTGALPLASVSGVETLNIRAVQTEAADIVTVNAGAISGVTTVNSDRSTSTVTVTGLAAGATFGVIGDGTVTNGASNFAYAAAGSANLAISGGTVGTAAITQTGVTAAVNTITSTGAANVVGVVDLGTTAAVTTLNVAATTNLTATLAAGDFAANSSVVITGAATTVNLSGAALSANITSVNASGLTAGGASVVLGANTTAFVGGAGNDTVAINALVFNGTTKVAAGAGTGDILVVTDAAALTAATAVNLTGFEVLRLADDNDGALDTFNLSLLSGITSLQLDADSAADGYSITNMNAAQAAAVTIRGTQTVAPTFGVTGAATVGQLDTLSLSINDGATAVSTITVANLNAAGVETVNIAATENFTATLLTGLTAVTNLNVTGSGNVSLTTDALAVNVNTVINASAATGTITIDATLATTNGLSITGTTSAAVNTLTGSAQADIINGGAGNDILSGLAGNDTINGGAGNDNITGGAGADTINVGTGTDTIVMGAAAQTFAGATIVSGTTVLTGIDKVTGMAAGDIISLAGILNTFTGAAGTTIAAAASTTVSLVRGNFVDATNVFTADAAGTSTLFVYDVDGAGVGTAVEAIVLVGTAGVTGTAAAGILTLA